MTESPPGGGDPPVDFAAFYRTSYARLCGQLYAYVGEPGAAEDLAQEALLRAWQRWSEIGRYADPLAWVRRVATNLATSRWRRLQAGARALRRHGPPPAGSPLSPDHVALIAALRTLSDRQRLAVVLHYFADQPVASIAAELNVPKNTVLSWLSRGRAKLAEQLRDADAAATDAGVTKGVSRHV